MKNIIVALLLFLLTVTVVKAGWGRLMDLDECVSTNSYARVCIAYDKQENVNCYTIQTNNGVGIYCMKSN